MENKAQPNQAFSKADIDLINKPRTKFSSNALSRVTKHVDLASKIKTISLNNVNVVSRLNLSQSQGIIFDKKVRTVSKLPKVMTLDGQGLANLVSSKKKQKNRIGKLASGVLSFTEQDLKMGTLQNIPEKDETKHEEEKQDDDSGQDDSASCTDEDEDSGESSIDMDGDDEDKLYDKFLNLQTQNATLKDAKDKGTHLDDLVDKETIMLLGMCKRLHKPKIDSIKQKLVKFGENEAKLKTLILDMDETMLHAKFIQHEKELENDDGNYVFTLQSSDSGSKDIAGQPSESDQLRISIKMRPYLDLALDFLSKYYEICVFTAGTQDYADACLDYLDPERKVIKHRLYRQHCVNPCSGIYVKDLRIIEDRRLQDIIIVDNSIISFAYQMDNGIPIKAYMRQEGDEELLFMVAFLEEIVSLSDPRMQIRKTFCLQDLMDRHVTKIV